MQFPFFRTGTVKSKANAGANAGAVGARPGAEVGDKAAFNCAGVKKSEMNAEAGSECPEGCPTKNTELAKIPDGQRTVNTGEPTTSENQPTVTIDSKSDSDTVTVTVTDVAMQAYRKCACEKCVIHMVTKYFKCVPCVQGRCEHCRSKAEIGLLAMQKKMEPATTCMAGYGDWRRRLRKGSTW